MVFDTMWFDHIYMFPCAILANAGTSSDRSFFYRKSLAVNLLRYRDSITMFSPFLDNIAWVSEASLGRGFPGCTLRSTWHVICVLVCAGETLDYRVRDAVVDY